ncbi:MAG: hypothetical protein U9Q04_00275 [Campylobacterota bacterium]|nr:hypothetical protein [Campylobacterota bacterium]
MKKLFLIQFILITTLAAKKDFYYSFITPDLTQMSYEQKLDIVNGNNKLNEIRREASEGMLDIALKNLEVFKNNNKIGILNSSIILLKSNILYQMDTKTKAVQAVELLEKAIHDSLIGQDDLLESYRLLVLLKLRINKADDAQYYAKAIEHSFDDPLSRVYSKIAMSQIYIKRREFRRAIKVLKKELIETSNLEIATIVADELYDAYLLNNEDEKAYNLVQKVLEKNIDYYANDSHKGLKKVRKLIDAGMNEFAIKILKKLLEKASVSDSIDNFKFILATTYMSLAGFEKEYMPKAKDIYEELIQVKEDNQYLKRAKMYLDEIIMREGKFDPQMIASKYSESESMQYKAMMQELLNAIADEKYELVIRMKKIYSGIPQRIVKRFGYKSIEQIYDMVNFKVIDYYLKSGECQHLNEVIKDVSDDTLLYLLKSEDTTKNLFSCMLELPDERTYTIAKNVYSKAKNIDAYFNLEKVAILLNKYDDAYLFSKKLDMLNDGDILSDEFLYRFLIYGNKDSAYSMEKFFSYARENREFITNNENNPLIIDFYYQFYLYLLKQKEEAEAFLILNKLYEKQNEMNARVYSPYVELELARYVKLDDDYDKALVYLQKGLNIKRMRDGKSIDRKIKKEDLAQIYYEIAKIYEYQGKENRYKLMIKKCKNLKDVDSFYKKMCDKL